MAVIEPGLRTLIDGLDPEVPTRITTMDALLAEGRAPTRFYAIVLSMFALFAVLLAGAGMFHTFVLYRQRTHTRVRRPSGAGRDADAGRADGAT
jgi:hypothetical protein